MSLTEQTGKIWFDGNFVDWQDANVHVLSHSLHYGMGAFEGIRAYANENESTNDSGQISVFRLDCHVRRLVETCHILRIPLAYDHQQLCDAHVQTLAVNKMGACYIRSLVFYGFGSLGISAKQNPVHTIVAAWPWGSYLGGEGLKKGVRIRTSSFTRHHINSAMCRAKCSGHYVNSCLANAEVQDDGYDEALLLDVNGNVAEGAGENLFMVKDGEILTPDLNSCLRGITRDCILTFAKDLGLVVREVRISRDDLYCADEAFFTGTAAEVTPIREIDNRKIGKKPVEDWEIAPKLQEMFFAAVAGKSEQYAHWLTPVPAVPS